MKTITTPFYCLLTVAALISCAQSARSATSSAALAILAFKSCEDAVTKNLEHTTLPIRKDYGIKLFVTTNPRAPKTTNVVVWIEDGPGLKPLKPENPRITAVCVNKQLNLPTQDKGEIQFQSKSGDTIKFRFHLENLTISKWKKKMVGGVALANDSIMMMDFPAGSPPPPPPPLTLAYWPPCLPTKTVHLEDDPSNANHKETEITFDFSTCANPTLTTTLYYAYELVLTQYPAGGGAPADYPIDPLIINKP
jgi:hypothetical protein